MNMLPFIDQCDSRSYILIVAIPCLDLLSRKFHGSELIIDHDPLEPSEEYKRTLGTWAAKKRARDFTLDTAAQATRMRWGDGPVEYFQEVIRTAGLELEFERAILNWDIRASCLYIYIPGLPAYSVLNAKDETRKRFAQNLLFFCLGRFDHYDNSSVVEVLQHEKRDWLQRYLTANLPCEKREELKQTIILFRGFLELSGGTVDCRRHNFGEDYTTTHNANLCAEYLGVSGSRQFGHFDPKEMQRALSKSELFAKASDEVPNPVEWSLSMMAVVPVGFPEDFLVCCYRC